MKHYIKPPIKYFKSTNFNNLYNKLHDGGLKWLVIKLLKDLYENPLG